MKSNNDVQNLLKSSISSSNDLFINSQVSPEHRAEKININEFIGAIEKAVISIQDTLSLGYFNISCEELSKILFLSKDLK